MCSSAGKWKDRFPPVFKRSIVREFNSQATDELGAPQGPSIHLALSCFVQKTLNRWAFVLTPSHLLTHPAPNERLLCTERTDTVISALPLFYVRIPVGATRSERRVLLWRCSLGRMMRGPFGNIFCSLTFWDFFQWAVCESSCFVERLGSCFLMPLFLVDWRFLVFSASHCNLHICFVPSQSLRTEDAFIMA